MSEAGPIPSVLLAKEKPSERSRREIAGRWVARQVGIVARTAAAIFIGGTGVVVVGGEVFVNNTSDKATEWVNKTKADLSDIADAAAEAAVKDMTGEGSDFAEATDQVGEVHADFKGLKTKVEAGAEVVDALRPLACQLNPEAAFCPPAETTLPPAEPSAAPVEGEVAAAPPVVENGG